MRNSKKILALVFGAFLVTTQAVRADGLGLNAGLLGGYSMVSSNSTSVGNIGFGARAGYKLLPAITVGLDWSYQSTTPSSLSSIGYSSNFSAVNLLGDYDLSMLLSGLYAGVKVGLGFTSAGGFNGTSVTFGAEAGYDYKVWGPITVGPNLNFLYIGAPTINGVSGNSGILFQALAAVRYWL